MRHTLVFLSIAAIPAALVSIDAAALEAGTGKAEITPPVGTPLNGYGDRLGRGALSVHDPLWARSLYLNDGQTALLWVTADLCLINPELRARVLELAPREVPRENVILTATHTHNGQGGMIRPLAFKTISGPFMPEVLEKTAQGFAEAMKQAYANRKRAGVGYAVGTQDGLSTNRRYDNGPVDPQVGVIRVDDTEGMPIAILTNFAAHPTMVDDPDHYAFSADYPGYFCAALEEGSPPGCLAMFANGAEGNQRPANPEGKSGWDRIESIGRLLAERTKEIAHGIACGDATLRVTYGEADMPLAMASKFAPGHSVLQTLEIDDLLVTFFPGEVCVELGLDMRKRALDRGYGAQFTVALANDYLGYFVPIEYYPYMHYETSANFYGPLVSEWFYRQFGRMMTRGQPDSDPGEIPAPRVETVPGSRRIVLQGDAYTVGRQRGAAFAEAIRAAYRRDIVDPVSSGALVPKEGYWSRVPSWIDPSPLALAALGIGSRPLLQGVSSSVIREVAGMADGVGLPFDAVWLVQATPTFAARGGADAFYRTALCTMVAAVGDRAGVDGLVVGRNLDWAGDDAPVIVETIPEEGHRFVQIGFAWNAGVFTGMNDAGLVVCVERMEALGRPPDEGAPIEFVVRAMLEGDDSLESALVRLRASGRPRGYHVLLADPSAPDACIVELGASMIVRKPSKGFLLGADPEGSLVDESARTRYARAAQLLGEEHLVTAARIRDALGDAQGDAVDPARIWNSRTRYGVVFKPESRSLEVAFAIDGSRGEYVAISIKSDDANPSASGDTGSGAERKPR